MSTYTHTIKEKSILFILVAIFSLISRNLHAQESIQIFGKGENAYLHQFLDSVSGYIVLSKDTSLSITIDDLSATVIIESDQKKKVANVVLLESRASLNVIIFRDNRFSVSYQRTSPKTSYQYNFRYIESNGVLEPTQMSMVSKGHKGCEYVKDKDFFCNDRWIDCSQENWEQVMVNAFNYYVPLLQINDIRF